jgi:hypothetical protein
MRPWVKSPIPKTKPNQNEQIKKKKQNTKILGVGTYAKANNSIFTF